MIAQLPVDDRFDIQSIPTPTVYTHIVTLIHRETFDEKCLHIETDSPRYAVVSRAIAQEKAKRKLFGYEVFEVLDCNEPF